VPTAASGPATATAPTTLTPTAPDTSPTSSIGEDIRDIRQPRHLTQPWYWLALAVGVLTLLGAAFALWRWLRRGKFFVMLPYEIALQGLEEARRLMDPDQAREYSFEVSTVIRRYIETQFNLQAPQLTTEEFLADLVQARETLLASHRGALGDFLQHCDLAKFAGWRYCRPDLEAMHQSAVQFVRQTATTSSDSNKRNQPSIPTPNQIEIPATELPHAKTA